MAFRDIFAIMDEERAEASTPKKVALQVLQDTHKKKKAEDENRGCEFCPSNKVEGIKKIKGSMKGRAIWVVAQSPGPQENFEGKELIGPAGELWWSELGRVGIERKDCDIQNVMRCYPADNVEGSYSSYLKMRAPSKAELHCCSLYTDEAVAQSVAKQILVLGQVAAKALLKVRSVPKNKIFYSEELKAKVYLLDHPSFFVRGYGQCARIDAFRKTLQQVATDRSKLENTDYDASDQFSYIRSQDYRLVVNSEQAEEAVEIIRSYASKSRRIVADIESDDFSIAQDGSDYKAFCCGFSSQSGLSFVFVWQHKDVKHEDGKAVYEAAKGLLQDPTIKKGFHYGCSDSNTLSKHNDIQVKGFDHDTNYSEWLRFSDVKSYGLSAIAERRFPEFSGYGMIIVPEMMKVGALAWQALNEGKKLPAIFRTDNISLQETYLYNHTSELLHLRHLSLDTLRLYNGGDCDLAKRIEVSNKKHIPQALMNLYVDLSFILSQMEPLGPEFDFEQCEKLMVIAPVKAKILKRKLRKIIGNKKFNPGSPQQVNDALYKTLDLEYPFEGKPNTRKGALLMLGREHEFPRIMLDWRSWSKVEGILKGYKICAERNEGRLRTRWWGTGTRTGRLSSGGEKNKKQSRYVNLQNIKKDANIKNMCVADARWRQFYKAAIGIVKGFPELRAWWAVCDKVKKNKQPLPAASEEVKQQRLTASLRLEEWVQANMPDLATYIILDYGQVEIRVLAQLCGDKNLRKDCMDSDIHSKIGTVMTGWDEDRIKNDEVTRTLTKQCIAKGQRVLTNVGLIPIEKVMRWMLVWDGVEFVSHDGVICQGEREVISYNNLSATPDHEVWTTTGKKSLAYAYTNGLELVVTGDQETPIGYTEDNIENILRCKRLSHGRYAMFRVQSREGCVSGQSTGRQVNGQMCMSDTTKVCRRSFSSVGRSLLCDSYSLYSGRKSELGQLWRTRNKEQVQVSFRVCDLHTPGTATQNIQRCRNRSHRQQWALRAWKSPVNYKRRKYKKQAIKCMGVIQGQAYGSLRGSKANEKGLPRYLERVQTSKKFLCGGALVPIDRWSSKRRICEQRQKAKVYDIINAGPRHRFTVEGKLVSNCHFGIVFGLSKQGVYKFVVAMSPPDMRDRITESEIYEAYDNYFKRYPGVRRFQEEQRAFGKEHKYVETAFGMKQTLNVREDDSEADALDEFIDPDEMGGRHAYWGNQAINGPVQGTAHQLMICALVNLRRQKKKYKLLGIPPMEVHDALYFRVKVLELLEAYKLAKYLLEQESLNTVASDFPDIKWQVPIVVEAKAGLRLGCVVKVDEKTTVGNFLLDWFRLCRTQERALNKELKGVQG